MLLRVIWVMTLLVQGFDGFQYSQGVPNKPRVSDSVSMVGVAVGQVCRQAASLLLLHDGSPSALVLLHSLLIHHAASNPRQVANILTWHQDPWHYYRHHHNSALGLTLLLIHNASSHQGLNALKPGWVYGPILLVALNSHQDFRPVLWSVNSARYSSLLQPMIQHKTGKYGLSLITLFPFNPPSEQFDVQILPAGISVTRRQLLTDRFTDFGGHTLELASWVVDFPILYWSDSTNVTAIGTGIIMMDLMGSRLNFTYAVQTVTPDGQWTDYVNGSWTGLLGQLVRREKDLTFNNVGITYDRLKVVDFSVPVMTDSFSVALGVPPPPPRWHAVFYPFTTITWIALAATCVITTLFFHLLIFKDSSVVFNHKIDVVSTLLWMVRALLRQSVPLVPSSPGTQPFLVCWWLVSLVLAASFVSNIIAYITVPAAPKKIITLKELADSKHSLYMGDYGTFLPEYLATSPDPVYRRLSQKLNLIENYNELEHYVLSNDGAFTESTNYVEYTVAKWHTDMYYVEEIIYPTQIAWVYQKGTPWVATFNWYLESMIESGLAGRWRAEEITKYHKAQGRVVTRGTSTGDSRRPLSLEDLQSAFYILGLGVMLSTLTLGTEFAAKKRLLIC